MPGVLEDSLPVRLAFIKGSLLEQGEYLKAKDELRGLASAHPENGEINGLLAQLDILLSVPVELIAPPGQGTARGGMPAISSDSGSRLLFTLNDRCYLYIFQVDSRNALDQIFPNDDATTMSNPLQPGKSYQLPEGNNWYILDRHTGVETVYFVASWWPAQDLEGLCREFEGASAQEEREEYRLKLVERLKSRGDANEAGVPGCFFKALALLHR